MDVSDAVPLAESLIPLQFQFGNVAWMEEELDGSYPDRLAEFVATEKEKLLNYIVALGRPESIARIRQLMDSNAFVKRTFQQLGILAFELGQFEKYREDLISLTADLSAKLDEIKGNQRKCWFRQQFKYWSNKKQQNVRIAVFQQLLSRAEGLSEKMRKFAKRIRNETKKFRRIKMKLRELHIDHLPMLAGYFSIGIVTGTVKPLFDIHVIAIQNSTASLNNWESLKLCWDVWQELDGVRSVKLLAIANLIFPHPMARIDYPREIWFLFFLVCGGCGLCQNLGIDWVRSILSDPKKYLIPYTMLPPNFPVNFPEGDIDLAVGKSMTLSWCMSYSLHSFISLFYIF